MLIEDYVEALLVDAVAADRVWDDWSERRLSDRGAIIAWRRIADGDKLDVS